MYVSPISSRFWFGRFTPAIRAKSLLYAVLFSTLALLVARVGADDHGAPMPLDHAAALAHGLDGRADFHEKKAQTDVRLPTRVVMVPGPLLLQSGRGGRRR